MSTVYFSAAIYHKPTMEVEYRDIVETLKSLGHTVHQDTLDVTLDEAINKSATQRQLYYQKVLRWMYQADFVVLEVSFPSTLHIGHELSLALERSKPVIAMYTTDAEPSFFLGLHDERIFWTAYQPGNARIPLKRAIAQAKALTRTKLNLDLPSRDIHYLNWMSEHDGSSKTAIIRRLIEQSRKVNTEYRTSQGLIDKSGK
jgi:hypothetical protein